MSFVRYFAAALAAVPGVLWAQPGPPSGWRSQTDRPAENVTGRGVPAGSWQLQEMIPGMHVTAGPGAVVFPSAESASGRFAIEATIVLFPDTSSGGYGIVFGGRSLGEAGSSWHAFLLDGDGCFSVVRANASTREPVVAWTPNEAILRRAPETVTNQLRVAVEPDSVRFSVNGMRVGAVVRTALQPDGQFGLRLDRGINVHVTNVDVTRRLLKR